MKSKRPIPTQDTLCFQYPLEKYWLGVGRDRTRRHPLSRENKTESRRGDTGSIVTQCMCDTHPGLAGIWVGAWIFVIIPRERSVLTRNSC